MDKDERLNFSQWKEEYCGNDKRTKSEVVSFFCTFVVLVTCLLLDSVRRVVMTERPPN